MMDPVGEITKHAASGLRTRLGHVYWIGGGSGAGKTTIASRLAARKGFAYVRD
jgi:adenylylsulfate kinase-like enzyme